MSEFKIKTICYGGKVIEVKVNYEICKFDTEDRWKNDWQNRKLKRELSLEELGQVVGGRNVYDPGLISDSAESEYFRKFSNEILQKALSELSEKQRRRIILRFFTGLTNSQISEIEKCGETRVENSILLALKNLRKILENF
jgi:RNA polymerase sigma factor (sigma-70 family)